MAVLNPETLKRIKRIEIKTRRLVNEALVGAYHSTFKGRGMSFDTVRPYEPGDDVRAIDWNVTARAGDAFVKKYVEERELTVMLVLDSSASSFFGTVGRQKRDQAVELAAVLSLTAITNNDRVGLLIFSDQVEHYTPPRKGRNHVLRIIRDLLATRPTDRGTDLALALHTVNRLLKQRAIIFLVSDFLAASSDYATELLVTSRRHDLIAVVLSDPRERSWPDAGLVALRDSEAGGNGWIDTGSQRWRSAFSERAARFQKMRDDALAKARVDRIDIASDEDIVQARTRFFRTRAGGRR
jgi:uncharacterized protein (DUF58 family)